MTLMNYIESAIYAGIFFLVVVTMGFFIDWKSVGPELQEVYGVESYKAIWVATAITSLALYIRVIRIIFKVLKKA